MRPIGVAVAAAFLLFSFASGPALAGVSYVAKSDVEGKKYVLVSGEFEAADNVSEFVQLVNKTEYSVVTFDSRGGNVLKAMELGRAIRALKMTTVQRRLQECASACALAFMGGVLRYAEPGSIGVHRSSLSTDSLDAQTAVSAVQEVTADVIRFMSEMGVDPALLELSLKYDTTDIRYLSASEMTRYKITQHQLEDASPFDRGSGHSPEQAILYVEVAGSRQPSQYPGYVEWKLVYQNGIPTVQASIAFVEPQALTAVLTFRKNTDASLPAAAIIETFISDDPSDAVVDTVESISMKSSEAERGDALVGIPAKITNEMFLFALNNFTRADLANRRLMIEKNWIDVALTLKDGRRSLLTLSKGRLGQSALKAALESW